MPLITIGGLSPTTPSIQRLTLNGDGSGNYLLRLQPTLGEFPDQAQLLVSIYDGKIFAIQQIPEQGARLTVTDTLSIATGGGIAATFLASSNTLFGDSFVDDLVNKVQVEGSLRAAGITDTSIAVNGSNSLTTLTIASRNTYLTGTAGASLAITLPTLTVASEGAKYTIMATATRASVTYPGSTVVGLPSTLTANTPITIQYSGAAWYISG